MLPDSILKSGRRRLTDVEWDAIKTHPTEGARIVSEIDGYQPIGEIILAHHERLDGKGYPRGLEGDEIPELARIVAVADTYDVMTARDTYRDPVSSYEAVIELRRISGTQLDARFVEALVAGARGQGPRLPAWRGRGLGGRAGARPPDPRLRAGATPEGDPRLSLRPARRSK